MSQRFSEWMAIQASADTTMVNMALVGALIVGLWFALRLWPASSQKAITAGILIVGGISYAASYAFALYVLVLGRLPG